MSISRSSPGSLGDDEAFALCVLIRVVAAIFGAGVLAQTASSGIAPWMAIGVRVAFGVLAPGRWGVAIGVTAAASLVAMAVSGEGAPGAVHLVFPATVVGSWLRPRPEAAQPVSWIDAMLIGAASESVLVSSMAVMLILATIVAMPLVMIGGAALGYVVGGVLLVAACGWMHVAYGRAIHRMFPERFGGFALGQVLPITLLALTGGEPLVLLIVAIRSACLWAGHRMAEADEVSSEPPPRITVSPGSRRTGTFR
jgi:hypothetical protein